MGQKICLQPAYFRFSILHLYKRISISVLLMNVNVNSEVCHHLQLYSPVVVLLSNFFCVYSCPLLNCLSYCPLCNTFLLPSSLNICVKDFISELLNSNYSVQLRAVFWTFKGYLTLWRRDFLLNFSTPCI